MVEEMKEMLIPDEIRSHSSFLTNKRLDIVITKLDYYKEEAWATPNIPNIGRYFACLYTLFDNVFSVLHKEHLDNLKILFTDYWNKYNTLQDEKKQSFRTVYELLFICDEINREMKWSLQRYEYFFKLGTQSVKSTETGLAIIHQGGGFFGGSRVPKVPRNPSESSS